MTTIRTAQSVQVVEDFIDQDDETLIEKAPEVTELVELNEIVRNTESYVFQAADVLANYAVAGIQYVSTNEEQVKTESKTAIQPPGWSIGWGAGSGIGWGTTGWDTGWGAGSGIGWGTTGWDIGWGAGSGIGWGAGWGIGFYDASGWGSEPNPPTVWTGADYNGTVTTDIRQASA